MSGRCLIGIDPGSSSGACILDATGPRVRCDLFRVPGDDARSIARVAELAYVRRARVAVLEEPTLHWRKGEHGEMRLATKVDSIRTLMLQAGRWLQACEAAGMRVVQVGASAWQGATGLRDKPMRVTALEAAAKASGATWHLYDVRDGALFEVEWSKIHKARSLDAVTAYCLALYGSRAEEAKEE